MNYLFPWVHQSLYGGKQYPEGPDTDCDLMEGINLSAHDRAVQLW